jgi:hypothetical protein
MERIQLEIGTPQDEILVAAWVDWYAAQQLALMTVEDKWQSDEENPSKRRRSLAAESPSCIAN